MSESLKLVRRVSAFCVGVALAACGADDEALISVSYRSDAIVPRTQTTVILSDGTRRYVITGAELRPADGIAIMRPTAMSGEAKANVSMSDAQGVIATGQLELPLMSDWVWGVEIHVDSVNPSRLCFGCVGSRSFPLRPGVGRTVRDSLWLTWGGNSIRNPVVY
ncbi:hypothetical protein [Gemmatimonas groenlandica]|uniref:Uncharacterized protein n=1 Tax=Gemmatimonas groenlandica TaxID=2732249 RepID=A0A6M4IRQ8_9BACT|nr:hypothetical protein [Gemmatimonas groenlandica]QJR37594.1 hypothetical protein HKW67_19770 [Gemmatimonas groenlandica]